MFCVTRRIEVDAAHRLLGYPGNCKRLHGHRYVIEVMVRGSELDQLGMLLDFGELKKKVKDVVDLWDHMTLLNSEDSLVDQLTEEHVITLVGNPTAENMARHIFLRLAKQMPGLVEVGRVTVYETPDCWASYEGDE